MFVFDRVLSDKQLTNDPYLSYVYIIKLIIFQPALRNIIEKNYVCYRV